MNFNLDFISLASISMCPHAEHGQPDVNSVSDPGKMNGLTGGLCGPLGTAASYHTASSALHLQGQHHHATGIDRRDG